MRWPFADNVLHRIQQKSLKQQILVKKVTYCFEHIKPQRPENLGGFREILQAAKAKLEL